MGWMNREPAEPGLPSDLSEALDGLRTKLPRCPKPELLQAAQADVLPAQQREDIITHLESCPACTSLLADLEALDDAPLDKAGQQRIWKRIRAGIAAEDPAPMAGRTVTGWSNSWLRPMPLAAMAAAVVILVVVGFLFVRDRQQPVNQVAQNHPVEQLPTAAPSVLRLEKPPVVLPASAVIVWRGQQEAATRQANALKQALAPYEMDNYAEAARRLERLRKQYPQMAEAPFYLGVSQLFLNQNEDAALSLKDAANIAEAPLVNDALWYLALANHRIGKDDLASSFLGALCRAGGKDSSRACAGAKELETRH
ncbi:MAG TPA: anti-sigma factor [Candidatus Angelobacter sp.]